MAAVSNTAAAFATAFRTTLAARFAAHGTLSAIRVDLVRTADVSADDTVTLITGPVTGRQEYAGAAMGKRVDTYGFPAAIQAYAPVTDTDTAFQAAMDRASLILDEVIQELRDNKPSVATFEAMVGSVTYDPFPNEKGGWTTVCRFTIDYRALVP